MESKPKMHKKKWVTKNAGQKMGGGHFSTGQQKKGVKSNRGVCMQEWDHKKLDKKNLKRGKKRTGKKT